MGLNIPIRSSMLPIQRGCVVYTFKEVESLNSLLNTDLTLDALLCLKPCEFSKASVFLLLSAVSSALFPLLTRSLLVLFVFFLQLKNALLILT